VRYTVYRQDTFILWGINRWCHNRSRFDGDRIARFNVSYNKSVNKWRYQLNSVAALAVSVPSCISTQCFPAHNHQGSQNMINIVSSE